MVHLKFEFVYVVANLAEHDRPLVDNYQKLSKAIGFHWSEVLFIGFYEVSKGKTAKPKQSIAVHWSTTKSIIADQ